MKSVKSGKITGEGSFSNQSSGRSTPRRSQSYDEAAADNEEEDEEDFDMARNITVPNDSYSASHEFDWISCRPCESPNVSFGANPLETCDAFDERIQPKMPVDGMCDMPSSRTGTQTQPKDRKKTSSSAYRSKHANTDKVKYRASPTLCCDNSGYRTSALGPSWCCTSPSPPPSVSRCICHGGAFNVTGMELLTYPTDFRDCIPYSASCHRAQSPMQCTHACGNYKCRRCPSYFIASEESSPGSPHGTYRPSSRRSRSSGLRKKESFSRTFSSLNEPGTSFFFPQFPRIQREEMWKKFPQNQNDGALQKINQLESDKKNLVLQVSVLSDQIEVQSEKISELEALLDQKKEQIKHVEQILQQEILARSSIENIKIQMMSELSSLKLRLSASDKDKKESEDRCKKLENDLVLLHVHFADKEAELPSLRSSAYQNALCPNSRKESNIEKLCSALEQVVTASEEKDKKIEELKLALTKCKKVHDYVLSEHSRKDHRDANVSAMLQRAEYSSQESEIEKAKLKSRSLSSKPPPFPRPSTISSALLIQTDPAKSNSGEDIPKCSAVSSERRLWKSSVLKTSSAENICPSIPKESSFIEQYGTMPRNNGNIHMKEHTQPHGIENKLSNPNIALSMRESISSASTANSPELPKPQSVQQRTKEAPYTPHSKNVGVSFRKGFFKIRSGKRSSSAPELGDEEPAAVTLFETESNKSSSPYAISPVLINLEKNKNKGFLHFFSRWKRNSSQNLERLEESFRRGGVRATSGGRLGCPNYILNNPDIPFKLWNNDNLVEWLHRIGLNMYTNECKRWGCNGKKMLHATPQELEKGLGIKNCLHKKKLLLAIYAMKSKSSDPVDIGNLDNNWVIRWLDDIGLPQYKDSFFEARIDGRVLNQLTVEDLFALKVTNQLHHISIRHGIQILREHNFDPQCLIRRSSADEDKSYTPDLVSLWTNHRVMEWLCTVDLSEYAPNLRGSGVHGALIVLESKFNTDLFAALLNIPSAKTLLRRHLATHFKDIIGINLAQLKRNIEVSASYVPLDPNTKVKDEQPTCVMLLIIDNGLGNAVHLNPFHSSIQVIYLPTNSALFPDHKAVRKGHFVLKRKHNKSDVELEELICPTDIPVSSTKSESDKLIVRRNSDPAPQEQRILNFQTFLK